MGAWDLYKQAKTNEHSPAWLQWMASAWLIAIVAGLEARTEQFATRGRCEHCGAEVIRYGIPVYKDAFIERAKITPGELPDFGAGIQPVVPICAPLYRVGPATNTTGGSGGSLPRLSTEDWLEYMRALA